ncbi:MAG: hypothetical protein WEC59_13130, partial [Salibacteraceae bacterium]
MIFFSLISPTIGQSAIDDVVLENVPYRKIRDYLIKQKEVAKINHFEDLKASCTEIDDFTGFFKYK